MLLGHTAGTIGGVTSAGTAFILGTASRTSVVPEYFIAVAGCVGALVAILSYISGRKSDPKQALLDHAGQDTERFNTLDTGLGELRTQVDRLVDHIITDKEQP